MAGLPPGLLGFKEMGRREMGEEKVEEKKRKGEENNKRNKTQGSMTPSKKERERERDPGTVPGDSGILYHQDGSLANPCEPL